MTRRGIKGVRGAEAPPSLPPPLMVSYHGVFYEDCTVEYKVFSSFDCIEQAVCLCNIHLLYLKLVVFTCPN